MQTTCTETLVFLPTFKETTPTFCPKHASIATLGTTNKINKITRSDSNLFFETTLIDVKIQKDRHYSRIVTMESEWEAFEYEPLFDFSFDKSMYMFLWTVDRFRLNDYHSLDTLTIDNEQTEQWESLLQHAEKLYNEFIHNLPYIPSKKYLPNVKMIAILIAMKFYYCDHVVFNSDFLCTFHLDLDEFTNDDFFRVAYTPFGLIEKKVGITRSRIRKMEMIFLSSLFNNLTEEASNDSTIPDHPAANSR